MQEHIGRYNDFANFLANNGYIVVGHDHLGHGNTAKCEDDFGYFADNNGWDRLVEDVHILQNKVHNEYPNLPYIVMGHSMGSLIVRTYITKYDDNLTGVIISGTSGQKYGLISGKLLIKIISTFKGKRYKSKLIEHLVTGSFNEQLECGDIYELSLRVAHENCDDTVCSVYGYNVSNAEASDSAGKFPDRGFGRIKHVISDNSNDKLLETERRSGILLTYAYVITKYMYLLRKSGQLENVLDNMTSYAADTDYVDLFNAYVMDFLNNSQLFRKIEADTAPFYIIMGDDICYGVLKRFAICLTKEFIRNGQAVITTDGSYGKKTGLECIEKQTLKGIVGFQAPVLFREYFKNIKAPKYVFWFDHPMYFRDMMGKIDNSYYMLCQDEYYAEFMRKYYHIHN